MWNGDSYFVLRRVWYQLVRVGRAVTGLGVGVLFGVGLSVSQMVNPEKVLSFLTLTPSWDPSLLFVMGAATVIAFFGFRRATDHQPVFDVEHYLPSNRQIDGKLMIGASLFGVGWGLAGYCPGPAITGLGAGSIEPILFIVSMIVGTQIAKLLEKSGA